MLVFCPALDCFGVEWGCEVQHAFTATPRPPEPVDLETIQYPSPKADHGIISALLESDEDEDDGEGGSEDGSTKSNVETHTGRWTKKEHELFLEGLRRYGKSWKHIANLVVTRTLVQIRTHAQKYLQKQNKSKPFMLSRHPTAAYLQHTSHFIHSFPENDIDLLLEDDEDVSARAVAHLQPIAPSHLSKRRRIEAPIGPAYARSFPQAGLVHPLTSAGTLPLSPYGWLQGA
ncbi:hypothetical protein ACHHYP_12953 [Achlya hypogyna]|uniref:Uncharacterized protein n=1 Tax=Achlya hypogyna TaxID=1202772 RepID=A0A1V9ZGA4_ACHHY|nr:hypothetical protein ACHHYP_12953 [Achlya hypogyna]